MPQLDKVTLFSQVFWLIFLYFFVFLIILKYYLPKFSKLFKLRTHYLNANRQISRIQVVAKHIRNLFSNSKTLISAGILENTAQINQLLTSYNTSFLKKANNLYVVLYVYNCLKFKVYKKLYL